MSQAGTGVRGRTPQVLSGWVLLVLGAANTVFGVLSMTTDLVRLGAGAAGGLVVFGVATMALGALVRQGRTWALTAALLVFGGLLVAQAIGLTAGGDDPGEEGALLRVIILAFLVGALTLARIRQPRR